MSAVERLVVCFSDRHDTAMYSHHHINTVYNEDLNSISTESVLYCKTTMIIKSQNARYINLFSPVKFPVTDLYNCKTLESLGQILYLKLLKYKKDLWKL